MRIADALQSLGGHDDVLSADEKEHLDHQGYLPLKGIMSPADVAAFVNRLEELAEKEGEEAGKEAHQEEGTVRLANLIDKGAIFEKCVTEPRVLAEVRHVIGCEFRLSSLNARGSLPGHGQQALHAEWGVAVEPGDYHVCNSIWMLTDFTTENGATHVVPGSHRSRKTPAQAMGNPKEHHSD